MARTLIGIVSSDKPDKTIVVTVATRKTHPIYKKQYTATKKFIAHDAANDAHVGDKVAIAETKPLSARKRYVLEKVIEQARIRHVEPEPKIEISNAKTPATPKPLRAKKIGKTDKQEEKA